MYRFPNLVNLSLSDAHVALVLFHGDLSGLQDVVGDLKIAQKESLLTLK